MIPKIVRVTDKFDTISSRFEFIFHGEKSWIFIMRYRHQLYSGSSISLDDQEGKAMFSDSVSGKLD